VQSNTPPHRVPFTKQFLHVPPSTHILTTIDVLLLPSLSRAPPDTLQLSPSLTADSARARYVLTTHATTLDRVLCLHAARVLSA
jgi:hypothetical protein